MHCSALHCTASISETVRKFQKTVLAGSEPGGGLLAQTRGNRQGGITDNHPVREISSQSFGGYFCNVILLAGDWEKRWGRGKANIIENYCLLNFVLITEYFKLLHYEGLKFQLKCGSICKNILRNMFSNMVWEIFRNNIYEGIPGKLLKQHFNVSLLLNPCRLRERIASCCWCLGAIAYKNKHKKYPNFISVINSFK